MDNILNPLSDFIQSNSREDIYIRFTLGKYSNSFGFDKQLFNRENFDKIKDMLESNKGWKDKIEEAPVLMKDIPGACDKHIAAWDSEAKSLIAIQKIKGAKSPVKKERI